jgi:hypothetical protein
MNWGERSAGPVTTPSIYFETTPYGKRHGDPAQISLRGCFHDVWSTFGQQLQENNSLFNFNQMSTDLDQISILENPAAVAITCIPYVAIPRTAA